MRQEKSGRRAAVPVIALAAAVAVTLALTAALYPRADRTPVAFRPSSFTRAAPLDINDATADELEALPGIGPALAAAVIEYREANGPFTGDDDILAVSGIGEKTLAAIAPYITCGEAGTDAEAIG